MSEMMYVPKERYEIHDRGDYFVVSRPDHHGEMMDWARKKTREEAEQFIEKHTALIPVEHPFFDKWCECGVRPEGWTNCKTGDVIWERCNRCRKPLYITDFHKLNKKTVADFDLDDFINS
jgi:hypothetical protein